ncbi:uncharacterized protein [Aegilops tauschii subsp. strangulata]|uniref:Acidic protein n=1 Tax=Aegilops tauschii subsp. strangulata TaxID=200361 RepID=A0A453SZ83_AEGTS
MKAKKLRVAAMAALCVLLVLVEQQQVAAMSEFCHCYRDCYSECRQDAPRCLCLPSCVNYCSSSPGTSQATVGADGGATCRMACKLDLSVCGWSAEPDDAADATICIQNCNRKWGHKAN